MSPWEIFPHLFGETNDEDYFSDETEWMHG